MNAVLPDPWVETRHRLAVGFEPRDALRSGRLSHAVRIDVEGAAPWRPRHPDEPYRAGAGRRRWRRSRAAREGTYPREPYPRVDRHDSCRHALLVEPSLDDELTVRLYDHHRRRVPRRLRLDLDPLPQVRRPALFPGAAYDLSPRATGLRGRVLRGGEPLRWARVEARFGGTVVGRAHGDDRGEFLLLLAPEASPFIDLADPLEAEVTVFAPDPAPVPASPSVPENDPFWDLPVEVLGAPGGADPVAAGEVLPAGYTASVSRLVAFPLGRQLSAAHGLADFEFP